MTDRDSRLAPAERVDDIERATDALRVSVRDALRLHKLHGNPVAVWRDGRVEWIPPEEIPVAPASGDDKAGGKG